MRGVDPSLQQDQLAQERARDQGDVGEVEHEADRAPVVGEASGDLVGHVTDRPLVEEVVVVETDDLHAVDLSYIDPRCGRHGGTPREPRGSVIRDARRSTERPGQPRADPTASY